MERYQVIQGDALTCLREMEPLSFDAIISDPPYASGTFNQSEKAKSTREKYTDYGSKGNPYPDFSGDAQSQRAWTNFMHEILLACRQVTKPGGIVAMFIDWRQAPSLTDAMQWAGWIWRGVAVWDKMSSRPQLGRFRQQSEFIIWGSNGALPINRKAPVLPGVFTYPNVPTHERFHQTQKPLALMRQVVQICEAGGRILDPFAGSGSTLEAALVEGYSAVGIELERHYAEVIHKRLAGIQESMFAPVSGEQIALIGE